MTRQGTPAWFERREESLGRRLALSPLACAALVYGMGARLHRTLYTRRGLWRRERLPCSVVSVGNLVVGGTGKTPTAAWLAAGLRGRGHRVALASRGYGGRLREPVTVVSDGRHVFARPSECGDEPLLLAAHAPGVPVLVARDRRLAGLHAIAAFGIDILVLDDGFQHHRLTRDLDLVTFDGAFGFGNGRLLPRGPLREPCSALARADAIVVVDGPLSEGDERAVREAAPAARWIAARRNPCGVRPLADGATAAPRSLADAEVGILTGIARPASLRRTLESLGAHVVAERVFPDHHRYRARDLRGLGATARTWVTTEKDAVKILPSWIDGADVRVLVVELKVDDASALLDWIEKRLRQARRQRAG